MNIVNIKFNNFLHFIAVYFQMYFYGQMINPHFCQIRQLESDLFLN